MKKLVFIALLALCSCSKEEDPEEYIVITEYYLNLSKECEGTITQYQVSEYLYETITDQSDTNDCKYYHRFQDVNGNDAEGYLRGVAIKSRTEKM